MEVTSQDFQDYWKPSRERTSSSMSGRHFVHYKAAADNNFLSELHASFIHSSIQYGVYLQKWTNGLSVMLKKIEGNIKVDKLRAILVMKADFNFQNKLFFGHQMIKQCEQHSRLMEELFGSHQNHSANEVAVNRQLTFC